MQQLSQKQYIFGKRDNSCCWELINRRQKLIQASVSSSSKKSFKS